MKTLAKTPQSPLSKTKAAGRPVKSLPPYSHTQEKKMSDNNKSGYQLRTDLLGMATGIVVDRHSRLFDNEVMKPEGNREPVAPYTTEDIIVEAEKLYAFVQKK